MILVDTRKACETFLSNSRNLNQEAARSTCRIDNVTVGWRISEYAISRATFCGVKNWPWPPRNAGKIKLP